MTASEHRSRAREALRGNWPMAALVTLVASVLGGVSANSGFQFNISLDSGDSFSLESILPPEVGQLLVFAGIALVAFAFIALIVGLVLMVIGCPIRLGYHRYILDLTDRRETGIGTLFGQFHRMGTAIVMTLLRDLAVIIGLLLLIVPGVILSLSFSMADFILLEDPECSGMEALRRSRVMMKGHKWELFVLDLSFIGWDLLAGLTMGIGGLFLTPYQTAARASFYRYLQNGGRHAIEDGYITVE